MPLFNLLKFKFAVHRVSGRPRFPLAPPRRLLCFRRTVELLFCQEVSRVIPAVAQTTVSAAHENLLMATRKTKLLPPCFSLALSNFCFTRRFCNLWHTEGTSLQCWCYYSTAINKHLHQNFSIDDLMMSLTPD